MCDQTGDHISYRTNINLTYGACIRLQVWSDESTESIVIKTVERMVGHKCD